jgi:hypothetical protein
VPLNRNQRLNQPTQQKPEQWKVRMTLYRSTWSYFTENPQGGGFGSTHCGSKKVALWKATLGIPSGETYLLTVNGKAAEKRKP